MSAGVLLLGSEPRIVVPLARCLAAHGIPVDVAGLLATDGNPHSRAIRHFARLPASPGAHFLQALGELARQREIDTVMAAGDSGLSLIAEHYDELRRTVHVASPAPHLLDAVLNKEKTIALARACGLPVPATFVIPDREHFHALGAALPFPLIAKTSSKSGQRGFKIRHFASPEELSEAFSREPVLCANSIFQEYCPGSGVGVEVLMHGGRPLAIMQHRRLKELPSTGGVSVLAVTEPVDAKLESWSVGLLQQLRWEGVAMVEFRQDSHSGRTVFMEINGRYWGSLAISLHAGIEFPFYEWQLLHGQTPGVPQAYRTGLRARWTAGELLRWDESRRSGSGLARLLKETAGLVGDCGWNTRDMLFAWSDPVPALAEAIQTTAAIMRQAMKSALLRLLPRALAQKIAVCRRLDRETRRVYLKRQLARMVRRRNDGWRMLLPQASNVLFVCHGNIMRSPMAAAMLRHQLPAGTQVGIHSAGLRQQNEEAADERAIQVAREFGICLEQHKPQTVTREQVEAAEVIFAMDLVNEAMLLRQYPQASNRIFLLAEAGESSGPIEIADPYQGDLQEVRSCYQRISRHTQILAGLRSTGPTQ